MKLITKLLSAILLLSSLALAACLLLESGLIQGRSYVPVDDEDADC